MDAHFTAAPGPVGAMTDSGVHPSMVVRAHVRFLEVLAPLTGLAHDPEFRDEWSQGA